MLAEKPQSSNVGRETAVRETAVQETAVQETAVLVRRLLPQVNLADASAHFANDCGGKACSLARCHELACLVA